MPKIQPEIRRTLVKPAIAFIGMVLLVLVSSVALRHLCSSHGQPRWESSISTWNRCADMVLIAAWLTYAQVRRTRAARK
jgi:hypothetical protein